MANEAKLPTLSRSVQIGKAMVFTGSMFVADSMLAVGQITGPVRVGHGTSFSDLVLEDQTGPMILDRLLMGENLTVSAPVVMPQAGGIIPTIAPTGKRALGSDNPYKPADMSVAVIPSFQVGGGLRFSGGVWSRLAGYGIAAAPPWTVTATGAANTSGATTLNFNALAKALPLGTRLVFSGGATHTARTTAAAAIGATSVAVTALPATITAAETASVSDPDAIPTNGVFMWRATADYDELVFQTDVGGRQVPGVTWQALYSFQSDLPADMKLGVIGDPMGADLAVIPGTFFFGSPT